MLPTDLLNTVQSIRAVDFDWPLPDNRIAQHPLAQRDSCLLLTADAHTRVVGHTTFNHLTDLLDPGTLLIYNDTRVINARLIFHRPTGAAIEIFCLEPYSPAEYSQAFAAEGKCEWKCLIGRRKRWKEPTLTVETEIDGTPLRLEASIAAETGGSESIVSFKWTPAEIAWGRVVDKLGRIPIPPYLGRDSEESDSSDYQTVYSRPEGSVAAPTAGLHFTTELLNRLEEKGVIPRALTLHVGAGTFRPVKSEDIGGHPMHSESFGCDTSLLSDIEAALREVRPIVAVGTTAVRTLESLYRLGLQAACRQNQPLQPIGQWEAYIEPGNISAADAIAALRRKLNNEGINRLVSSTSIIIAPGYRWRIVNRLITNFHQPQSTLLLLVSSFLGDRPADTEALWRQAYTEALERDYRFLSYGDAMLLDGGASLND